MELFKYKHISSLTTHLKRHFREKKEYLKKAEGLTKKSWRYYISVECFRKICYFCRHSERKVVAKYWLKKLTARDKLAYENAIRKRELVRNKTNYLNAIATSEKPTDAPIPQDALSSESESDSSEESAYSSGSSEEEFSDSGSSDDEDYEDEAYSPLPTIHAPPQLQPKAQLKLQPQPQPQPQPQLQLQRQSQTQPQPKPQPNSHPQQPQSHPQPHPTLPMPHPQLHNAAYLYKQPLPRVPKVVNYMHIPQVLHPFNFYFHDWSYLKLSNHYFVSFYCSLPPNYSGPTSDNISSTSNHNRVYFPTDMVDYPNEMVLLLTELLSNPSLVEWQ